MRLKPDDPDVLQLVVTAVGSAPALDVKLDVKPPLDGWDTDGDEMPRAYPIVSEREPAVMDVSIWHGAVDEIGESRMLHLAYHDRTGQTYTYESPLLVRSYPTMMITGESKLVKAVNRIADQIDRLSKK